MNARATIAVLLAAAVATGCGAVHTAISNANYGATDQRLQVGEDKINFLAGGHGDRCVAFVHGNPGFGDEAWPHQVLLENEFSWVRLDRPGHGSSTRRGNWPFARQVELLEQALNERRSVILVAHGAGAALAIEFARRHPQRTAGLVLLAPITQPEPGRASGALSEVPVLGTLWQEAIGTPTARFATVPAAMRREYVGDTTTPIPAAITELFDRSVSQFSRPGQVRAAFQDDTEFADHYATLRGRQYEVAAPVVILYGDLDRIADPTRHARHFAWCRPATAIQAIPGAGHRIHVTHPQEVASAIRFVEAWVSTARRPAREPAALPPKPRTAL
ncbi:MAG: alpha/beta hydrolase [Planctomycetes bacterium]|nr:alpha/beta hydrolase [Planctomycetota bacterium]